MLLHNVTDVPPDIYGHDQIDLSCWLSIGSSIATLLVGTLQVHFYFFNSRTRESLASFLNDMAIGCCIVQLLESTARIVFSSLRLRFGMSAPLCDVSATTFQFLEPAAQMYAVQFFVALAFLRRSAIIRSRSRAHHIVPFLCAALSVAALWAALGRSRTSTGHFTAHLPWCWIPPTSREVTEAPQWELIALRLICATIFYIATIASALLALVRLMFVEGRGSWGASFRRNLVIRYVGTAVFPVLAYTIDHVNRYSLHDKVPAVLVLAAFTFPLMGCVNGLAFMASEGQFSCRHAGAPPKGFSSELSFIGALALRGEVNQDSTRSSSCAVTALVLRDPHRDCGIFMSSHTDKCPTTRSSIATNLRPSHPAEERWVAAEQRALSRHCTGAGNLTSGNGAGATLSAAAGGHLLAALTYDTASEPSTSSGARFAPDN